MKFHSKKLLLLVSGLVLGGVSLVTVGSGPCDRVSSKPHSPAIDALHKITQTNPLNIQYVNDQDSGNPKTTAVLRAALQKQSKVFTPKVAAKITFRGLLTAGKSAKITATYNGQGVDIFVQEGSKPPAPTPVIDALQKIDQKNPLKIKYVNDQDSSNPKTTAVLRAALQKQSKVFTSEVVKNITFKGQLTAGRSIKITATYNKQEEVISVQEGVKPPVPTPVIDALHKITQTNPLNIEYVAEQDSSNPKTTAVLRAALQKQSKVFTLKVVAKITFKGLLNAGKSATITATYNGQGVDIFVQEKVNQVLKALKEIDQNFPLTIKNVFDQDASHDPAQTELRTSLIARDKSVFTEPVVQNITFKGQLTVGRSAKIIAIYHNQKVDIYVQEVKDNVIVALRQFEQKILKIEWVEEETIYISLYDPFSTQNLRTALVAQDETKTITTDISSQITFTGLLKKQQTTTVTAFYKNQKVKIQVFEKASPIIDTLYQFNRNHSLTIKYVGPNQDSSDLGVRQILLSALVAQDKNHIITDKNVVKIYFEGILLAGDKTKILCLYRWARFRIWIYEEPKAI